MNKKQVYILAVLLLSFFTVLAVTSVWPGRKSATADELAHHIPVGYVLLSKGDLKMDPSQPPLARYLAALPLVIFMDLSIPDNEDQWRREDRSEFGRDFFYKFNDHPDRMLFYSRCSFIVIGLLCGIILFVMARSFYGDRAALFSLFLYSFSPNIIAHTRLSTVDMTATCFILLSVYTFWRFLRKRSLKNIVIAGGCLGLAQLSKYTSLLLYPTFIFLTALEIPSVPEGERARLFKKLFVIFACSIILLWAGYGFDSDPILNGAMRVQEKLGIAHSFAQKLIPFWNENMSRVLDHVLLNVPVPLGTHMQGTLGVMRHGYEGHSVYFLGQWSGKGNPLYFVLSFMVKTPIPSILFIVAGFFLVFKKGMRRKERFLLTLIAVIFLTASLSKLQLGHRYVLPMYPFCFILAGRSAELWKKPYKIPISLLMVWYLVTAFWIWPDYISYFNETIGGPANGYKYLRDSNIDWGQDLPALAEYMRENDMQEVRLMYFGSAEPSEHGIRYKPLEESETIFPGSNVYAISVHKLERVKWARYHEPDAKLGYSIFVYDFREDE
ncbi:MAG: glycosyltransferase family 39 protein [Candidatus Omnitrophota bacterium]